MTTRLHFVKKARKDHPNGIKKGDSYYWWAFRYGGTYYSKTRPRSSQLENSPFIRGYMGIQETLEDALNAIEGDHMGASIEEAVQEASNAIDELRDETQDSLDNMPYELQDGDTGQLLQERIDALEYWQQDLEGVDVDPPDEADEIDEWAEGVKEEILSYTLDQYL